MQQHNHFYSQQYIYKILKSLPNLRMRSMKQEIKEYKSQTNVKKYNNNNNKLTNSKSIYTHYNLLHSSNENTSPDCTNCCFVKICMWMQPILKSKHFYIGT